MGSAHSQLVKNPFTPSFGKVPPHMAGREQLVDDLLMAIDNGPGDPNLATLVIGARGTGKTALLTRVSREAGMHGWLSVDVSARPGMRDAILVRARKAAENIVDTLPKSRVTGIKIGQIGVDWETVNSSNTDWRMEMESLLDQLAEAESGLLITIDEVRADLDEMVDFVSDFQHFVREDRPIALLMAGLPFRVSLLLSHEDISFLRRAQHRHFGRISDVEIRESMRATIEEAGRSISPEALQEAVTQIDGFPYMMQLVGYRSWAQNPHDVCISLEDVQIGASLARSELADSVFEVTFRELSNRDQDFLFAMAQDDGESMLSDVAARMDVGQNYAGAYKRRLLEQGVIEERGRGVVAFALPSFRSFLLGKQG